MSSRNHKRYRRIYEAHFGKIPKDEHGRSYDVHHKDGNHENNDPSNLIALPIHEHYRIHRENEDWGSCWAISLRMKMSPKEISEISRKTNTERVNNGTHNFLNGEIARKYQRNKVNDGTHHFFFMNKGKDHSWYDHTIRTWKNKITGQIVRMTNYELRTTFNLKSGAVSRVVNNKGLKSTGGWEIISDQNEKINNTPKEK